jgi:HEAT repeat protein
VAVLGNRFVAANSQSASENSERLLLACFASLACVVAGAILGHFRPQWIWAACGAVSRWKRAILIVAGVALVFTLPPLAWQWYRQSIPEQAVPRLLRDPSPAAQAKLEALGTRAVPGLIDSLGDRNDDALRTAAAMQLCTLNDPRAVEPLIRCVEERPVRVRWAIMALSMLKDARAVEPLLKCLKNDDHHVRCSAANALANIGGKRAFDELVEILNDEEIKQRESQEHLARGDVGFRATAAAFLWRCGDARAFDIVLPILEDEGEDPGVRAGAALSLAELGDRRAIPALTRAAARPTALPGKGIDRLKSDATRALQKLDRN